jgi:secreted trypsin-like serine protease
MLNILTKEKSFLNPHWNQLSGCLIFETFRDEKIFTSTCVAIDNTTLLTAAHSAKDIDAGFVHFNFLYDQKNNHRLKVKEIFIHPDYNEKDSLYLNDIAIIKLETPLPESIATYNIKKFNYQGIERVGFGGRDGKNIRTWTHAKCLQVTDKFILCEDWCSTIGDSGGPLFEYENGSYHLVGIHSTLEGDQFTYAVNLESYREWIEKIQSANLLLQA